MKLKGINYFFIDILFFFLLAVLLFVRLGFAGIIDKTDADFPLYPIDTFSSHLYLWSSQLGLGLLLPLSTLPQLFPYNTFIAILDYVGFPVNLIERIWLISIFSLLGISMYLLSQCLISADHRERRLISIIVGFYFMFSPFVINYIYMGEHTALFVHAMWPFLFAFLIKYLDDTTHSIKYVIYAAIASTGIQIADPGVTLMMILPIIIFFIYLTITSNTKLIVFKGFLLLGVLSFFLNIWWIFPLLQTLLSSPQLFSHVTSSSDIVLGIASGFITLGGAILQYGYFISELTPNLAFFYKSTATLLFGFAIVTLSFSFLLFKQKKDYFLFFAILGIIAAIFSMGINEPYGYIYKMIWTHFPPFRVFRNPLKFVGMLSFAIPILLCLSLSKLTTVISSPKLNKILLVMITISIAYVTSPILTGDYFINKESKNLNTDMYFYDWLTPVNIPAYYTDYRNDMIKKPNEFRVLILPQETWLLKYKWSLYDFAEILKYISPKPIIYSGDMISTASQNSLSIIDSAYFLTNHNLSRNIGKFLGLLNIRYLLVRDDTESYVREIKYTAPYLKKVLINQHGINKNKIFGDLTLYEISEDYFLPHIYTTNRFDLVNDNAQAIDLILQPEFHPENTIYIVRNHLSDNQIKKISDINTTLIENMQQTDILFKKPTGYFGNKIDNDYSQIAKPIDIRGGTTYEYHPELTFQRINPTKYIAHINASRPFFLVFSESYNPQWQIYIEDIPFAFNSIIANYKKLNINETAHDRLFEPNDIFYLFKNHLPDECHFIANGYANAWYINKTGTYDITLYYLPQSFFYIAVFISITTFIISILYVLISKKNK